MTGYDVKGISISDRRFTPRQRQRLAALQVKKIDAIGDENLLFGKMLGLLCSVKCPGKIILQTYDFMISLRKKNITVVSGFHSPMERECLNIVLKGRSNVIICYARSIRRIRIPTQWGKPIEEERMLLLSVFPETIRRPTVQTTDRRNMLVGALAGEVLVPYAAPGSRTALLIQNFMALGISIRSIDSVKG